MKTIFFITFTILCVFSKAQANLDKDIKPSLPFEAMPLTQAPELKNDPFAKTIEIIVKNNAEHPVITEELKKSIEAIRQQEKDTFYNYSADIMIKVFSRKHISVQELNTEDYKH